MTRRHHHALLNTPCPACGADELKMVEQKWGITTRSTGYAEAQRIFTCRCGFSWDGYVEIAQGDPPFIVRSAT